MTQLIPASHIVVQEFLAGGPEHLYSYATVFDGERAVVGMAARRSRQHPMDFGHATTYAESIDNPEIAELATRILRAMNYRGVAEVEFMYDERSQSYKFLEINGRMWGWHSLATAAGVNIPYATYQLLTGVDVSPAEPRFGVKWIRLVTDTPTVLGEMLHGRMSLGQYARSFRGPMEDAVFSWKDPLPFFMEILMIPYLWWKKGF
jgi:predicted ATP-grasp superfamily ATP-dependent carboligase